MFLEPGTRGGSTFSLWFNYTHEPALSACQHCHTFESKEQERKWRRRRRLGGTQRIDWCFQRSSWIVENFNNVVFTWRESGSKWVLFGFAFSSAGSPGPLADSLSRRSGTRESNWFWENIFKNFCFGSKLRAKAEKTDQSCKLYKERCPICKLRWFFLKPAKKYFYYKNREISTNLAKNKRIQQWWWIYDKLIKFGQETNRITVHAATEVACPKLTFSLGVHRSTHQQLPPRGQSSHS